MVDETKWYYTTLPGSMASYGERTQIRRVKNHSNLPAYLANWPQYTQENSFQGTIKRQGGPFSRFAQAFSALIVHKKTLPTTHSYVYVDYATVRMDTSMIHLCSIT